MGEAAPQAATTTEEVLEALRFDWGGFYTVGFDEALGWWASRPGVIGHLVTAGEPDELRAAMAGDLGPLR